MKIVKNNGFEKMFDYIYYGSKKDKNESAQEFKKISKKEKYKLDMLKSFVNDNKIEEVKMIDLNTFIVRFQKINKKDNLDNDLTPKSQTQDSVVVIMTATLSFLYLYSHMFYSILLRT